MRHAAWWAALVLGCSGAAHAQSSAIPDAPTPQAGSGLNLKEITKPGAGTETAPQPANPAAAPQGSSSSTADQSTAPPGPTPNQEVSPESPAPDLPAPGKGPVATIVIPVNEVIVPVTIRDKKGAPVHTLDWRQFRVFEDGVRQRIVFFTSDPFPLSTAFVVDQSLPADTMSKVNESLAAVHGAFTPADTLAVFGYNTSTTEITGFSGAQGARVQVALSQAKAPGRDLGVPDTGSPFLSGPTINNKQVDPNLQRGGSAGSLVTPQITKEQHPLNDAILAAAIELAKQPRNSRRRVLYVISDGKENGSKASYKEVVRFLLTNNIAVYGTLVGDSAVWGEGFLDKFHLPLVPTQRDNILPKYALATGGSLDSQVSERGIQTSFAKITQGIRNQYTLGYLSKSSTLASQFHTIEVRVEGLPNLEIIAPDGYYPSARGSSNNTASR